jgi:hypothetical protein
MKNGIKKGKFQIRIKPSSLSEDEKRRLLFECFDILLASSQKGTGEIQNANFEVDSITTKEYDNIVSK